MRRLVIAALVLLVMTAGVSGQNRSLRRKLYTPRSYSTSFPNTENPISEGGNWVNGFTTGLDWSDVRTTPGLAFTADAGTGTSDPNDQTAILTGTWGPNVHLTGVMHYGTPDTSHFQEVEFRLRSTLSAHVNSGYEINFSLNPNLNYTQIVRWNGAHGSFDYCKMQGNSAYTTTPRNLGSGIVGGVVDGDTAEVFMTGNNITVYVNSILVNSADVSTDCGAGSNFTSGNPGIGFYNFTSSNYGWSSFSAVEQ